MATKSTVPTVANGDSWSASQQNTYLRDNIEALWPYTTAGDISYASAANQLSRLAKPSADSVLKNTSGGVPSWLALTALKGTLHTIQTSEFSPGGQAFSSGWANITLGYVTLTLTVPCTVVVFSTITGYNSNTGRAFMVRATIDGVADPASYYPYDGGLTTGAKNETIPYVYVATGITAGSRLVRMQCTSDSSTSYVERGRIVAAAFVE